MNKAPHQVRSCEPTVQRGKSFELMLASLLPYHKTWQPLARSLPKGAYLIITRLGQKPVNPSLLRLVRSLRRQGLAVYVLSVGK